ncbi:MAG TPA: branched-chain amino acid ABC transporter permease [Acidimicrobiales bacterium]|nr:branched-chain amino acid ABC transporter permease [Acidimicrobiales bacterium]
MSARWTIVQGSPQHRIYRWVGWGSFVAAVLLIPLIVADVAVINIGSNSYKFTMSQLTLATSWAVAVLGVQVIVGYTGQLTLGNSFFAGVGAYLTAILVADYHWSYVSTLVVVLPITFLLGMAIGLPALRIRGLYLALVTISIAALLPSFAKLDTISIPFTGKTISELTNGSNGKDIKSISKIKSPDWIPWDGIAGFFQGIPVVGKFFGEGGLSARQEDTLYKYLIMLAIAVIAFWLVRNLLNSRVGRALQAIRDNETSAAVSGVDLALYKTLAFGVSAALAGVAGTMYAIDIGFVNSDDFGLFLAVNFVVGLVVGGVINMWGAVVGGLAIVLIPSMARSTQSVPLVKQSWLQGPVGPFVQGVLLILLTFVLPGGIVYGIRRLRARFVQVVPPELAAKGEMEEPPEDYIPLMEEPPPELSESVPD